MKRIFLSCLSLLFCALVSYSGVLNEGPTRAIGEGVWTSDNSWSTASDKSERTGLVSETDLREASAKAIRLIQKSQADWWNKETCTSCHHQLMPEIPFKLARERGVALDEKLARESEDKGFSY